MTNKKNEKQMTRNKHDATMRLLKDKSVLSRLLENLTDEYHKIPFSEIEELIAPPHIIGDLSFCFNAKLPNEDGTIGIFVQPLFPVEDIPKGYVDPYFSDEEQSLAERLYIIAINLEPDDEYRDSVLVLALKDRPDEIEANDNKWYLVSLSNDLHSKNPAIRMLDVIFSPELEMPKKIELLAREYGIDVSYMLEDSNSEVH